MRRASHPLSQRASRATQATQLLAEVERFRQGHEEGRGLSANSIPLVVAGDFNASPCGSQTTVPEDQGGYDPLCYQLVISHPLALRSAFPVEDTFTTWKIRAKAPGEQRLGISAREQPSTKEVRHCIDYVWVSDDVMVEGRSSLPGSEELGPSRIPSLAYPSDHLALAVELLVRPC